MSKLKRMYRKVIHKLIVKYLVRCGGAFHQGAYGDNGRYVKLFTDDEYGEYQKMMIKSRK